MVDVSGLPSPSLVRFRRRCLVDSLSNAPDTLIQASMKRSISDSVVVGPRLTRIAPRARSRRNSHGGQHVGGLDLARGTGGTRGHRHAFEIEGDDGGFGLHPGDGEQRRIGQPLGLGAENDDVGRRCLERRPRAGRASAIMRALSAARPSRAAAAAAPKPAMPATFSVPARSPRSWPPPLMSGVEGSAASRLISAPTPLGAPILCPEMVRRSAPSALISHGIRPAAWTASTCRRPPAACTRRAACETG